MSHNMLGAPLAPLPRSAAQMGGAQLMTSGTPKETEAQMDMGMGGLPQLDVSVMEELGDAGMEFDFSQGFGGVALGDMSQ